MAIWDDELGTAWPPGVGTLPGAPLMQMGLSPIPEAAFGPEMPMPEPRGPGFNLPVPTMGKPSPAEFMSPGEPMAEDFWSRLAMGGGLPSFRLRRKPSGIEVLLALAAAIANVKAGAAAGRMARTEKRSERAREAARTLATWRHQEQERERERIGRIKELRLGAHMRARYAGPEDLVQVVGPDGQPIWMQKSKAVGRQVARAEPREGLVQIMRGGKAIWVRPSEAVGEPAPVKATTARPSTSQERQTLAYYHRAREAIATITAQDKSGRSLEERMARAWLPGQVQLQFAPNIAKTDEQQRYRQAQRAFTEARLRKESGAAIPPHEYENDARTYFMQPGDSRKTVEQKQRARNTLLEGLKFSAGSAYREFYEGTPEPGTAEPEQIRYLMDENGNLIPEGTP